MTGAFISLIFFLRLSTRHHLHPLARCSPRCGRLLPTACRAGPSSALLTGRYGFFRLAPLITAIGMSIVLQNYIQVAQGARVKPLQPVITGGYTLIDRTDSRSI